MADEGKALMLKTAADIGKYYAFIGQALRAIYDPAAAAQLPAEVMDTQLKNLRDGLAPVLDTNPVVKQNFAEVDAELERLRLELSAGEKKKAADEARAFAELIQERAKVVSDLVALFRRL